MPRKKYTSRSNPLPDSVHGSLLVTKFISSLMSRGKRSTAERVFYRAMTIIEEKSGQPGITIFKQALANAKPVLEVKSRRVGGATYQVPVEVRPERRTSLAIRWIIDFSSARSEKSMEEKLAAELMAASKKEGGTIKKREDTHKMAEANKAFAHYRW
jgi:small subunit ribosomal protein S7